MNKSEFSIEVREILSQISDHQKELELIGSLTTNKDTDEFMKSIIEEALEDAKSTIAHAKRIVRQAEHSRFLRVK